MAVWEPGVNIPVCIFRVYSILVSASRAATGDGWCITTKHLAPQSERLLWPHAYLCHSHLSTVTPTTPNLQQLNNLSAAKLVFLTTKENWDFQSDAQERHLKTKAMVVSRVIRLCIGRLLLIFSHCCTLQDWRSHSKTFSR
ncbi:hypothetical protein PMIN02_001468 [Paraphaeosphaeria minitans]